MTGDESLSEEYQPASSPPAYPGTEWSREPFVPVAPGNPHALRNTAAWAGACAAVATVVTAAWHGSVSAYRFGECCGIALFPAVIVWLVARVVDKSWQWWKYPAWIAVGAMILLGGQALSGLQESHELAAKPHTVVKLPRRLLGTRRTLPPALTQRLQSLNAEWGKKHLGGTMVAAEYTKAAAGGAQITFVVLGINNAPGGEMDKESTSSEAALTNFLGGAKATEVRSVPPGVGGGSMKCGKLRNAGVQVPACFWVAFGREGAVLFPHGGAVRRLAEQTRRIRAAVEKRVADE